MNRRRFALIGYPLGHTMSPFIHERLFNLSGHDFDYQVLEISPDELLARTDLTKEYEGLNVTIPHKQSIIRMLDELDDRALLYGAVNTVRCGDIARGYNTDAHGFLKALESGGASLTGRVVLCGAGGAARMMAFETVLAGAQLTIAVREADLHAANVLKDEILAKLPDADVLISLLGDLDGDISLLLNATPLGMHPHTNAMAVSKEVLSKCAAVFDAVYNPARTLLLKTAAAEGSVSIGGMPMLVWQAVVGHQIWDNAEYRLEDIQQLIADANEQMARSFHS